MVNESSIRCLDLSRRSLLTNIACNEAVREGNLSTGADASAATFSGSSASPAMQKSYCAFTASKTSSSRFSDRDT
jgi:hypothetical protein